MKIRIAIFENDKLYLNRFFDYMSKNYSDKVEIHGFSSKDTLTEFLDVNDVEILLVSDIEASNFKQYDENLIVIQLAEKDTVNSDIKTILKYQKISLIYKEILNVYSEKYKTFSHKSNNLNANIISFMSSGSGTGTSLIASSFAKYLSLNNKKVLFLDIQAFPTVNCIFNGDGKFSLSEIIFAIKSNKADINARLESSLKIDKSGVMFYDSCSNPLEQNEITKDDLGFLLEFLKNSGLYEYIIVDMDYCINEISKYMLKASDKIVFVSNSTNENNLKLNSIFSSIDMIQKKTGENYLKKISIIYNKFIKEKSNSIRFNNIHVLGYLPMIENIEVNIISEQLARQSLFDNLIECGGENGIQS